MKQRQSQNNNLANSSQKKAMAIVSTKQAAQNQSQGMFDMEDIEKEVENDLQALINQKQNSSKKQLSNMQSAKL